MQKRLSPLLAAVRAGEKGDKGSVSDTPPSTEIFGNHAAEATACLASSLQRTTNGPVMAEWIFQLAITHAPELIIERH